MKKYRICIKITTAMIEDSRYGGIYSFITGSVRVYDDLLAAVRMRL